MVRTAAVRGTHIPVELTRFARHLNHAKEVPACRRFRRNTVQAPKLRFFLLLFTGHELLFLAGTAFS